MPLRSDWSSAPCPIARSLDVLGDPWVLLIARQAFYGTRRFADFREHLDIADNVLSRRLAMMVDGGLLQRVPYRDDRRTRDEYVLTAAGEDLLPILHAMVLWAAKHERHPAFSVLEIVHRACGSTTTSADHCSGCGAELQADQVAWRRTGTRTRDLVGAPG
jgi:DNA-binding HxlR family transcriptional regulator